MKSIREFKAILVGGFYGVIFITQIILWTVINYTSTFEKSIWFVIGTAALMTVTTCSMYLLLRKLNQRIRGYEDTLVEDIYEYIRTDG